MGLEVADGGLYREKREEPEPKQREIKLKVHGRVFAELKQREI